MKFRFDDDNIECNNCGHRFTKAVPHEKAFLIECPDCSETGTYIVEWYINEIEDEEIELVP